MKVCLPYNVKGPPPLSHNDILDVSRPDWREESEAGKRGVKLLTSFLPPCSPGLLKFLKNGAQLSSALSVSHRVSRRRMPNFPLSSRWHRFAFFRGRRSIHHEARRFSAKARDLSARRVPPVKIARDEKSPRRTFPFRCPELSTITAAFSFASDTCDPLNCQYGPEVVRVESR